MMRIDTLMPPFSCSLRTEHRGALALAAWPWFDNEAVALTPMALAITGLLMLTAVAALALAWFLQAQLRKNRQLAEQGRAQQAMQQGTLDALPFPVLLLDLDGQVKRRNRASAPLPAVETVIRDVLRSSTFAAAKSSVLDGADFRQEMRVTAPDGRVRDAQVWIRVLHDGTQPRGYTVALLDISEFRDAERDARQTEQQLADIAGHVPIVALAMQADAAGPLALRFATGDTRALFQLDVEALRETTGHFQQKALLERVHPADQLAFDRLFDEPGKGTALRTLDFRAFGQIGPRWIRATVATLPITAGGWRLLGYFIDITEQHGQNEALRTARDVAERASKAKADFLANMSHEIRTPMNGVLGMLELLGRTPLDAEQRELLRSVEDSGAALLQILNDILDFSKLEAGDLRLDPQPFEVRAWLDQAVAPMATTARNKGIALRVSVGADVAGQWRGDSMRLRQILINLLNNAIKFTERGSVTVRLTVTGDSGTHQQLSLSVTDTGIGIPADKQATLFKPFAQAESSTSRRYGGTGLGLAISSQLVTLMDGEISLSSEMGVGTTVSVNVRLPVVAREANAPSALHGRHAIVRLASTSTAADLEAQLRAAGLTVECIAPGQPLRPGMAASLLFVDANAPDNAAGIESHVVYVIDAVMTPNATGTVPLEAHPLRWRALLRACLRALELDDSEATVASEADAMLSLPALSGYVLIAEDHPVSQRLIARQLALLGLSCDIVDNGHDALEALSGGDYALLLTDGNMPQMSGYELAQSWRSREAATGSGAHLPILLMTANALSSEALRATQAGIDDVLSKPLQLAALSEKLSHWLPALSPAAPENREGEAAEELRLLFADASEADLEQLRQHAARRDLPAATQCMHRLLGVLPLFAEPPLLAEGQYLFDALHDPAQAEQTLPELAGFADRLERWLADLR